MKVTQYKVTNRKLRSRPGSFKVRSTHPFSADRNIQGPHHTPFVDLSTAKDVGSTSLTPPGEWSWRFLGCKKSVNISQEKLGSRVLQVDFFHVNIVHVHACETPELEIQNNWEPPFKLSLEKAYLLCSPPSSARGMGSFSLGSLTMEIHRFKTRLGTGVPRSPEFDPPRSSVSAPTSFS